MYCGELAGTSVCQLNGGQFVSQLGGSLLFAVLIERTVVVFLTIWRAEEANNADDGSLIKAPISGSFA